MTQGEDPTITTAVAIGRLEEGQKHLLDGFKELNETVKAAIADSADLRREHAITRRDVDGLLEREKTRDERLDRRRPPWTAIVATVVASGALIKSLFIP